MGAPLFSLSFSEDKRLMAQHPEGDDFHGLDLAAHGAVAPAAGELLRPSGADALPEVLDTALPSRNNRPLDR